MSKLNKLYDKSKSFLHFQENSNPKLNKFFLNELRKVLNDPILLKDIKNEHLEIIKYLKSNILEDKIINDRPKFTLTPNVLKEIEIIQYKDKLRYLVHRYRYDIYPLINKIDSFPPYLQIEPTSFCNYRCVFCFQSNPAFSKRSNGFMGHMKLDTFKKIIDSAENNIEFISLASRGEPLICRDIELMLKYTVNKFLNLKINTNASVLTEKMAHAILSSGVTTLVFSADAADDLLYSKLRVNGNLKKILKNIENFKKIKDLQYPNKKIITRVSGVKVDKDQDFIKIKNFWESLVDQVAFVDYCPWEDVYNMQKNQIKKACSELSRRMYIWWDGKANPCEVDFKSDLEVGNIFNSDIKNLWLSKKYNQLRKNHLESKRNSVSPCNKCLVV